MGGGGGRKPEEAGSQGRGRLPDVKDDGIVGTSLEGSDIVSIQFVPSDTQKRSKLRSFVENG
jgi:hypothetical protein